MLRGLLCGSAIAIALGVAGAERGAGARADVPAVFRTCASVPWKAPSLAAQRRHLGRNPRWSTADRSDPLPALEFPFILRIRSASISYDQSELGGLWTLRRGTRRALSRCPQTGGPRRHHIVVVKGWRVERAELTEGGDLVAYGRPRPGRLQVLNFPGYGNREGFVQRRLTLERSDAPGCAISSTTGVVTRYANVFAAAMSCAEVRAALAEVDEAEEWGALPSGIVCASVDRGYAGERVTCTDGGSRSMRFDFSYEESE
ncbi:hypothetical protein [Conexibacter arvalis]|uniref:Uncharacterized protein n=1 Tax=Conexibacter arvalis TaxID=912552 RepID=A0A840IBS3_9ACTN|nr:hypothetical protein [Conexibacter arvalis]MBB4662377.1 hypothetical protein [Conexibacter arvalis]